MDKILKALRCIAASPKMDECSSCEYHTALGCNADQIIMDAANLLEQLTADGKQQWISVADEMPEWGTRVLATDGIFVGEAYRTGDLFGANQAKWYRSYGAPWSMIAETDVTHWMPLPVAPKFADLLRGSPEAPEKRGKE